MDQAQNVLRAPGLRLPVSCGNNSGLFIGGHYCYVGHVSQKIEYWVVCTGDCCAGTHERDRVMGLPEYESHSGRAASKNWKQSVRVGQGKSGPLRNWIDKVCSILGEAVVGSKVHVRWPVDGQFYVGRVHSWDEDKCLHRIMYDDGNQGCKDIDIGDLLKLAAENWQLLPNDDGSISPAASRAVAAAEEEGARQGMPPGNSTWAAASVMLRFPDNSQQPESSVMGPQRLLEQRAEENEVGEQQPEQVLRHNMSKGKRSIDAEEQDSAAGGAMPLANGGLGFGGTQYAAVDRDPLLAVEALLPFLSDAARQQAESLQANIVELSLKEKRLLAEALDLAPGQLAGPSTAAAGAALPSADFVTNTLKTMREGQERTNQRLADEVEQLQNQVEGLRQRLAELDASQLLTMLNNLTQPMRPDTPEHQAG